MPVIRLIHSRFYKYILILVVLLFSTNSMAKELDPPLFLKNFNRNYDTVGFAKNLYELEVNFDAYNRTELIDLLVKSESLDQKLSTLQLSQIYFIIKKYYDANGNKAMSFEYALKIYKLLIKTNKDENLLWILIDIGNIFYSQKDYDNAVNFYRKAETIGKLNKQYHPVAVVYLNYGLISSAKGDYDQALMYLRKSNVFRTKSENIKMIADNYNRMAIIFLKIDQPDSSLFYIQKAKFYYENKGIPTTVLSEIPNTNNVAYAKYFLYKKDYDQALKYISEAKKYSKSRMLIAAYIEDFEVEKDIYLEQKQYDNAIESLNQLLTFLKQNKINDQQINVYKNLAAIYSIKGDYKNASNAYSNYIRLEKFWDNSNVKSKLNLIRSVSKMYESNIKIQESREKLEIERINYELKNDEKNTSIIIIIVSLISFFVFFILFLTQRNSKRKLKALHQKMVDQNLEISLNSEELEKSNHLKDKLFSIIAHDLRNPLNRMLVELAILKKAIRNDEQIDRMEITLKETIELFEGLLQWSKIDGKKNIYNSTKINLNDCILKTLKFYENEILKRQISVEIDLKVNFVYADVNIINTFFKNLISNGILYAAKTEEKRIIEIKATQISSKTVEIYVSNSGPIFSKELISEFYQQDENIISTSSGLGLSICKLLAKLCGWKIDIGNISDQGGAYLTMEIPIYNAESLYSSMNAEKLNFPEEIRIQLKDLKKYKFYQISQIRHTIKSFRDIEHAQAQEWIDQIDLAVNEGNEVEYLHLLSLLDI